MPTFKNLCQFGWTLRTGQYIEQGGEVEVSDEDAQILSKSPYLAEAEAETAPADEQHKTPEQLRAEAAELLAEANQEEHN